jgi:hypothetical protein
MCVTAPSGSSLSSGYGAPDSPGQDGNSPGFPTNMPAFGRETGAQWHAHAPGMDPSHWVEGGLGVPGRAYPAGMQSQEGSRNSSLVGITNHAAARAFLRASGGATTSGPAGHVRDGSESDAAALPSPGPGSKGCESTDRPPRVRFMDGGDRGTLSPSLSSAFSRSASSSLGVSFGALGPTPPLSRDLGELHSYVMSRATSLSTMVEAQRTEPGGSSTRLADLATAYAQLASLLQAEGMAQLPITLPVADSTPPADLAAGSVGGPRGVFTGEILPPINPAGSDGAAQLQECSSGTDNAARDGPCSVGEDLSALRLDDAAWSG